MMSLLKNKLVNILTLMILGLAAVVGIIFILFWVYKGENYTDDDLFRKARECFSNEIEMADFTEEVMGCFINTNLWNLGHNVVYPQEGTYMSKIVKSLPASMFCWQLVKFDDAYALAFRFGCHSNYAYLVVVDTDKRIVENLDVRCVTNNIVVVFNRELLLGGGMSPTEAQRH